MGARYFTTPIYYVNGDPHIGHAHTSVMADVLRRAALMRGDEVFLSTGTDEHGQKNQQSAEESGLGVREYLDRQSGRFRALFERLNVGFDFWTRTSSDGHKAAVQAFLSRLMDRGLVARKEYSGVYCVGCEQFKRPSDLDERGRCSDHPSLTPQETSEVNYFLTLAPFQDWLVGEIERREDWIRPGFYRRELLAMLASPLEDLCISRPKSRVWLGVDLPFDPDYVTYVWFDALVNYVSNIGWPDDGYLRWWPGATHLLAKDILKTHCIYWPIMLRALDIAPPAAFRVHGYWVGKGGVKMSKTLGNVVDPGRLADLVGVDGLRFYLARAMTGGDAQISESLAVASYNSDLANNIGNLYSRVAKSVGRYFDGAVPAPAALDPADAELQAWCLAAAERVLARVDLDTIAETVQTLVDIGLRLNGHFEAAAPWNLAKDPGRRERLESVLYACLDCLRVLFELAWPLMPATAERALANVGAPAPPAAGGRAHDFAAARLRPGARVGGDSNLFPRIKP